MLPSVTHNIGLSVSEAYSKLKQESFNKWKQHFTVLAHQRGWVDPTMPFGVYPRLPPKFLPIYFSLRTQALKTDYVAQNCTCDGPLNYNHLFVCSVIRDYLKGTLEKLSKYNKSLTPSVMSCEEGNKSIMRTFVIELANSPIGALI